jgi:AAA ATPase domain
MNPSLIERCRAALANLDAQQPLDNKDLYHRLYRDRGERTMEKLRLRLEVEAMANNRKLVFSGHIGSGKSTELYHLKRELDQQGRATILYFPVKRHVNLVGMTGTRLLEAMARELELHLHNAVSPKFEEEIRRASETYRRVRKRSEGIKGSAELSPTAGLAKGGLGLDASRITEQEWVYENLPDPTAMLELVNNRIRAVKKLRGEDVPVVLICDDLEKLDVQTAEQVFAEGLALAEVEACTIYTVPVALLYSERSKSLLGHFDDDWTVLPIIKVVDRDGKRLQIGVDRLREMVKPRVPFLDDLLEPGVFEALASSSGGVVRDLIRMLREICLRVVAQQMKRVTLGELKSAEAEIRRSFGRQVPTELMERLKLVSEESAPRGMDPQLARLLNLAAVLEYANDDTWYRVHPLASHLFGTDVAPGR